MSSRTTNNITFRNVSSALWQVPLPVMYNPADSGTYL